MKQIDSYNFNGKKAIVRVDFNVPLNDQFEITDDTRIRAAIPTLKKVLAGGGALIIMSHLGRPKGPTEKYSLKHILGRVSECLGVPVQFAPDCQQADAQAAALKPGEVLVLENLRFYAEEEGKPRGLADDATDEEKKAAKAAVKESQKAFTKKLASYADCYINDAFGTAHRAHASTALIAKYFPNDKMFGYLMEGGGVGAVGRAESVVDVAVSVGSEGLDKVLLAGFHDSLGGLLLLVGSVLRESAGLAFLLGVEAEILEQQGLARLEGGHFGLGLLAVGGELHRSAEALGHMIHDMLEGELVGHALRTAEVGHDDEGAATGEHFLEGRHGPADAGVVRNFELLVEGNVEVHAHDRLLAGEIVGIDVLLHINDC